VIKIIIPPSALSNQFSGFVRASRTTPIGKGRSSGVAGVQELQNRSSIAQRAVTEEFFVVQVFGRFDKPHGVQKKPPIPQNGLWVEPLTLDLFCNS
jgi:hypothetical protein